MPAKIHTHDRVVESRILLGELVDIQYDLVTMESGGQPIYQVAYCGDKYAAKTCNVLRKTEDRAEVTARAEQVLRTGDSYRVDAHMYHEAVVEEDVATATIVCMHSPAPGVSKVLGSMCFPDEIVFRRVSQPVGQLLSLL